MQILTLRGGAQDFAFQTAPRQCDAAGVWATKSSEVLASRQRGLCPRMPFQVIGREVRTGSSNAGEGAEKREPSSTVGGNGN